MSVRIADRERLQSPDASGRRALALDLVEAALAAVEPERATREAVGRLSEPPAECTVFAFGKAAEAMTRGALDAVPVSNGIAVGLGAGELGPVELVQGDHPIPGNASVAAGRRVLDLATELSADDVALCLVSGGASAMLELPRAGVTLDALRRTTELLLASGASISEVNAIRRRLSRLKGGGLARALAPARVVNVVLSDVPGADPAVVAAGPTLPPPASPDAASVLARYDLADRVPADVRELLAARTTDVDEPLRAPTTVVAADNEVAQRAVVHATTARGLVVAQLPGYVEGEARDAGRRLCTLAAETGADVVVWGGETTVRVVGTGRGGRNQELVLGVLGALDVLDDHLVLSIGTDGVDGTSEAAGALADRHVAERAHELGLDASAHLADNDAAPFFEATNGRIATGPTGTNVADLCLWLR